MIFCVWASKRIGKNQGLGFVFGLLFPILAPVVYLFLMREYKKKGKVEFRIF
jgi:hypothetical protein